MRTELTSHARGLQRPGLYFLTLLIYMIAFFSCADAAPLKRPLTFRKFTTKNGLSSEMVNAIAIFGNGVWFGTYGGGASLYDKERKTWRAYTTKGEPMEKADNGDSITWKNLLSYNHVSVIVPDSGSLWFGTYFYGFGGGGISCREMRDRGSWLVFDTNNDRAKKIVSMAVDGDLLWVGSEKGLSLLDKKNGRWKRFYSTGEGLSGNFVNAIVAEPDYVWLGTNEGICRLDKTRDRWKIYTSRHGMAQSEIKSLARVGKSLWAGRADGQVFDYDYRADRWKRVETRDRLKRGGILSMTVTRKWILICRDNGVSIMERSTGQWDSLTTADGLVSNNVFCAAEDDKGLWFGTDKGVSRLILAP
jgi:hypothetical protein